MRRILLGTSLALAAAFLSVGSATAQDYPPSNPPGVAVQGGQFTPGGSGNLGVCALAPTTPQSGSIDGGAIPLSGTSDASGCATFTFSVPSAFVLNASHTLTLDGATTTFCVNSSGAVASCASIGGGGGGVTLPRTGSDNAIGGLQIGLAAIAAGTLLVLWRRRRLTAAI